jgi:hypothetical protein
MKNVKDVQVFLGGAGYYRRFIHKFALITSPLTELRQITVEKVFLQCCHNYLKMVNTQLHIGPKQTEELKRNTLQLKENVTLLYKA